MTDSPESLINAIIMADDRRRRAKGLPSTRAAIQLQTGRASWGRVVVEPIFNILGHLWGSLMYLLPWGMRKAFVQWVNLQMSGHAPALDPHLPERIQEVRRMVEDVKAKTGKFPTLFVLTSHPDTAGENEWLRFEVVRHGVQLADAYLEVRRPNALFRLHPQCFVAIDPFALDTVPHAIAGFYAGWMHRIFLAWDRQPSAQTWIQKHFLLRGTTYTRIVWRLLEYLKSDIPVVMVLSGGLPYNARLLYAAREFVHRLMPPHWTVSKRKAQIELMSLLVEPEGPVFPAERGELPESTKQRIRAAMERWGVRKEDTHAALDAFAAEFKLPVPYRARLFRMLVRRVGKPIVVAAVAHGESEPFVRIWPPVLLDNSTDISTFSKTLAALFPS